MRNLKTKFAEDITAFGLFILGIILLVILMSSCSTTRNSGGSDYQKHLSSSHHDRWVKQDNGGCGWHN
jgi:hypothetical protein